MRRLWAVTAAVSALAAGGCGGSLGGATADGGGDANLGSDVSLPPPGDGGTKDTGPGSSGDSGTDDTGLVPSDSGEVGPEAQPDAKTCASVGQGPGIDSCCGGQYCNGECNQGTCFCEGTSFFHGCPAAAVCCAAWTARGCSQPDKCKTCADVVDAGNALYSCCLGAYCIGACDGRYARASTDAGCGCGEYGPTNGCLQGEVCCPSASDPWGYACKVGNACL